jgi:hypothetical protein
MHQSFSGAIRPGKVNMTSPHAYEQFGIPLIDLAGVACTLL